MQPVRVQVRASQLLRGPVHRQTQVKQRLNEVIHGLWSKKKKAFREKELIVNSLNQYSEKLDNTKISMSATLLLESYINERSSISKKWLITTEQNLSELYRKECNFWEQYRAKKDTSNIHSVLRTATIFLVIGRT